MGVTFSPTLDFGTILQIIAFVGSVLYFIYDMRTKILGLNRTIEHFVDRMEKIEKNIEVISDHAINIARIEERMNAQDIRIQSVADRISEMATIVNERMHGPLKLSRAKR